MSIDAINTDEFSFDCPSKYHRILSMDSHALTSSNDDTVDPWFLELHHGVNSVNKDVLTAITSSNDRITSVHEPNDEDSHDIPSQETKIDVTSKFRRKLSRIPSLSSKSSNKSSNSSKTTDITRSLLSTDTSSLSHSKTASTPMQTDVQGSSHNESNIKRISQVIHRKSVSAKDLNHLNDESISKNGHKTAKSWTDSSHSTDGQPVKKIKSTINHSTNRTTPTPAISSSTNVISSSSTTLLKTSLKSTQQPLKPIVLHKRSLASLKTITTDEDDHEYNGMTELLRKHNQKFQKSAYEPSRHSVRDVKRWELLHGKTWSTLSVEDKEAANKEIATMKQS